MQRWLSPTRLRTRRFDILTALGLAFLVVLLYWPARHFSFVSFDDPVLIFQNPLISALNWHTLRGIFTSFDPELYVPLTLLSYQIDTLLHGLEPGAFHMTNILLHAVNVALVHALIRQFSYRSVATITALLFAVHPLNVETTLWLSARKDLLSAFFFLLSLNAFIAFDHTNRAGWYIASLITFACALLSKVTVLTLPIVLLLIPLDHGSIRKRMRALWPFFAFSIVFGIIALIGKQGNLAVLSFFAYPLLSAKAIVFSLWHLIFPHSLSPLYSQTTPINLFSIEFSVPLLLCAILIVAILKLWNRSKPIAIALLFFLITFAPSFLTFVKNGDVYFTSDRYVYIPAIGIFFLVPTALHSLWLRNATKPIQWLLSAIFLASIAALSWQTRLQLHIWRDNTTLFTQVLKVNPHSALAYNNLGSERLNENKLDEARALFVQSVSADPHYILPRVNLAAILLREGKKEEAIAAFRTAIASIDPAKFVRSDDLIPYYFLAELLDEAGEKDEAIALEREAATRGSMFAEPHYNLALILHKYGQTDEAIAEYRKAITIDSWLIDAHYKLAELLAERGDLLKAKNELELVITLDPEYGEAQKHLENVRKVLQF